MNNPIWVMTSAFKSLTLDQVIARTKEIGAQGMELCVFRRDGTRTDHVATHIDYESFGPDDASRLVATCNREGLRFSVGAYENLIGGDPAQRALNQDHLLKLIRIAHLCGGDKNDVRVGTFVGYNHELGAQDGGFEKNLEEYARVFGPIIRYAEDLGVTVIYENCPMEGWRPASSPNPLTRFRTPSGNPASRAISAKRRAVSGLNSAGLCTTVQPAASAGAIFHDDSMKGVFQGVMTPTGPIGLRLVTFNCPGACSDCPSRAPGA